MRYSSSLAFNSYTNCEWKTRILGHFRSNFTPGYAASLPFTCAAASDVEYLVGGDIA
jgi:hypothetical protein